VDRVRHLPQDRIPGGAHDRAVEGHVRVVVQLLTGGVGARALRSEPHALEGFVKGLLGLWRDALGRQPCRLHLEDPPAFQVFAQHLGSPGSAEKRREHVGVEAVPCVLGGDDRAVPVPDGHEPALLQAADALARDASAHPEARRYV
jgi:hypothetical protein